jgi:hypothetical protein
MRIYLNAGNDIMSPDHMKQAILSSGGVPALSVTLSGPPVIPRMPTVKLKGVSLISNVEYCEDGIRVWKAYGIGPGKVNSFKTAPNTRTARDANLDSN